MDDPQQEVQTPPNPDEDGFLYHYTSLKAFLGIIGSKTLRATDIKFMNDTMEHKLATGLVIDEIFKRIAEQNPPEGQSFAELTWPMGFFLSLCMSCVFPKTRETASANGEHTVRTPASAWRSGRTSCKSGVKRSRLVFSERYAISPKREMIP